MDKQEYAELSRRHHVSQRSPLIGYCQRWAWTVYFYSYYDPSIGTVDIQSVLEDAGCLPADYASKKVTLAVEPPEFAYGVDYVWGRNLCPEVALFDDLNRAAFLPSESISSFSSETGRKLESVESKHFSQCLEFIQNSDIQKPKKHRPSVSQKLRFQVFQRDKFTCTYCGKSARDGAILHADHKVSIKDGGESTLANLVTSCSDCNFGKSAVSISEDLFEQC
jgi:hypothetical protein